MDEYITMAFAPSALVEQLIALEWPSTTALRILLTSGVLRNCPPAGLPFTLVNTYGTAETAVVATSGPVLPQAALEVPPIGRPIDNVSLAILDESMQPVPSGKPGELYIGGAGIARGYVNQPDLTARKFVRDPHSPDPQARLYRTGDLGAPPRRWPNRAPGPPGRSDYNARLPRGAVRNRKRAQHAPGDRAQRRDRPRTSARRATPSRLRGTRGGHRCWHRSLGGHAGRLAARAPARIYAPVRDCRSGASQPLTRDGKVDRVALPAPQPESEPDGRGTSLEARLAQLMASLLEVDEISPEADFFQAGGHPLMAAVVLDRVRQVFGVTLTPGQFFEAPTVSGIAAEIERAARVVSPN